MRRETGESFNPLFSPRRKAARRAFPVARRRGALAAVAIKSRTARRVMHRPRAQRAGVSVRGPALGKVFEERVNSR